MSRIIDIAASAETKRKTRKAIVDDMMSKIRNQIYEVLDGTGIAVAFIFTDVEAQKGKTEEEVRKLLERECHDFTREYTEYVIGEWEMERGNGS